MDAIPTIDLSSSRAEVALAIDAACRTHGFFQIVRHGVDPAVVEAAWLASRAFFDLPLGDRLAASRREPGDAYGYVPFQGEALERSLDADADADADSAAAGGAGADLKHTMNIGPVDPPRAAVTDPGEAWAFGHNPWPPAAPAMRPAWEAYFRAMLDLSARLMSHFAEALGLPADHFDASIDESPSALRAIDYPHQDVPPPPGSIRAGAHTDYGTLTVLRQDDAPGGLQVLDRSTMDWLAVPHVADAFVINLGDLMQQWTNDRWHSTLHRVVNPPLDTGASTRRQSMAFFHNANYHAVIECLPTCLEPGGSPRHAPVVAGPHLQMKYLRATS